MHCDQHMMERAMSVVASRLQPTPLMRSEFLSRWFDADIWLKCEQFQPIGAFKIRGATFFAHQTSAHDQRNGFVTHSSGNHAQAVAFVAHQLGVPARVVMPENSNQRKVKLAQRWGAEVILCQPTLESRESTAQQVLEESNAVLMPPYDHPWIMAGQSTCAQEIMRANEQWDTIIAPLGGGGLLSGTALAAAYFAPQIEVIGAEPEQASDGYTGWKTGTRQAQFEVDTIADGLRTMVGAHPFDVIQKEVNDIWLAPESEIAPWTKRIWQECKLLVEYSSAVPFAAMEQHKDALKGKRVAVILTGGNVDLDQHFD